MGGVSFSGVRSGIFGTFCLEGVEELDALVCNLFNSLVYQAKSTSSSLQGDTTKKKRLSTRKNFENGSIWRAMGA